MGNNLNGKRNEQKKTYYQHQIHLFKWRADPSHNTFLPRVYFCKKQQQLQRERFKKIPLRQVNDQFFIDMKEISELLIQDHKYPQEGEIIVFEKYACKLSFFKHSLNLQECLYVFNSLLQGYERIFYKIGKTHIQNDYCFVTTEGEVRAWFNPNPTSNQFPRQQITFNGFNNEFKEMKKSVLFNGQASIIKKIVDLNYELSNGQKEYLHFHAKIKEFLNGNILHHTNFNAVRKFINKYLFNFRLIIPFNLLDAFSRMKSQQNIEQPKFNANSYEKSRDQLNRTSLQLSTNANLQYSKQPFGQAQQEEQQSRKQSSFQDIQTNANHTFIGCKTPKTDKSTFVHSQIMQSRYQKENMHTVSFKQTPKILQKNKTVNDLKYSQASKFQKKSQKQINSKSAKISVKFHSRQASMQQETNSMCIPVNAATDFGVHYSYNPQISHTPASSNNAGSIMSIYKKRQEDKYSGINEKIKSGIASNKSLSICQSIGTFQSIDNNKDSGYRGILLKMGKTVKILNQPTNNNFNAQVKGNHFDAYMTN